MNLPIDFSQKNILFAGIGGGYDFLGAIPLWAKLELSNNITFSNLNTDSSNPEDRLQKILNKERMTPPQVYKIPKAGVKEQIKHYNTIIEKHKINTIVAIDGGVDALMTGKEKNSGTFLEDLTSLIALNSFSGQKYLVCLGFGTETEEDLSHYHVLRNISRIIKDNGFLGCCSLLKEDKEYKIYKDYCDRIFERKSHIHTKIISSILGETENIYKDIDARVIDSQKVDFISVLSSIYWFFNLDVVLKGNELCQLLKNTNTNTDVLMVYRQFLNNTRLENKIFLNI